MKTNKEIVKEFIESHEPETFARNEYGVMMYKLGHSGINLEVFFEDLVEHVSSLKDKRIEELEKQLGLLASQSEIKETEVHTIIPGHENLSVENLYTTYKETEVTPVEQVTNADIMEVLSNFYITRKGYHSDDFLLAIENDFVDRIRTLFSSPVVKQEANTISDEDRDQIIKELRNQYAILERVNKSILEQSLQWQIKAGDRGCGVNDEEIKSVFTDLYNRNEIRGISSDDIEKIIPKLRSLLSGEIKKEQGTIEPDGYVIGSDFYNAGSRSLSDEMKLKYKPVYFSKVEEQKKGE